MEYCYECKHYEVSDGENDQSAWCKKSGKFLGWIGPKNDLRIPQDCPKKEKSSKKIRKCIYCTNEEAPAPRGCQCGAHKYQ